MKFKELSLNDMFTIEDSDVVYTKVKTQGGTCCTPKHNARAKGKKHQLFDDDVEVTRLEVK